MQSIVENYLNGLKSIITVEQAENLVEYFSERRLVIVQLEKYQLGESKKDFGG